ncbi:dihydroxy-acid dehydratase [Flavobacterium sp. ZB4P13]
MLYKDENSNVAIKVLISLYIEGGLIALVEDNDLIEIDALNNTLNLNVSSEVIEKRRRRWMIPQAKVQSLKDVRQMRHITKLFNLLSLVRYNLFMQR